MNALELSRPSSNLIEVADFATADDCQQVIDAYERCRATYSHKIGDGFFDHRVLWINSFPDHENAARHILQGWRRRATSLVCQHVGRPVYSDTIQVVKWQGEEMPPHHDDRHPNGGQHNTPWRAWASVIYLNDDFDGGQIYFPQTTETYQPVRGSLIFFPGPLLHGVRAVNSGFRYTSPSWYSYDQRNEDYYARIDY